LFDAIATFTKKLNPFKRAAKQTPQKKSMKDSLKRLKKREEKLAKLFNLLHHQQLNVTVVMDLERSVIFKDLC
jgi:hypothetical protein